MYSVIVKVRLCEYNHYHFIVHVTLQNFILEGGVGRTNMAISSHLIKKYPHLSAADSNEIVNSQRKVSN